MNNIDEQNSSNSVSFDYEDFEEFISSDVEDSTDFKQNERFIKSKESRLSERGSKYLAAALEDGIRQILILRECNKGLKIKSLKETDHHTPDDQLEKIDPAELANDSHKIAKMNSDRDSLMEILIKLYLDMKINRSYASLLINLADITAKTYQLMAQELRHKENRRSIKNLQSEIKKETRLNKSVLENCDLQIHKLQDEIADEKLNCKIKLDYVTDWQNARIDQYRLRFSQAEKDVSDSLEETKVKIDQEIRVNQEMEKFISFTILKFSDKVEYWKKRFREESDQIDNEICEMKSKRKIQDEKMEEIENLIETRQKEIDSWLSFVDERNKRIEREKLLQRSAILLQAWWRGVMVRRRLAAKQAKDSKRKSAKKKK